LLTNLCEIFIRKFRILKERIKFILFQKFLSKYIKK